MLGLTVLFDPGRVIVSAGLALEATPSGEMLVVASPLCYVFSVKRSYA
jgi:hypothetical protein